MGYDIGKAKKVLTETFVNDNEDVSEDKAMELIVKANMIIRDLEEERENDDALKAAKIVAKDLASGYSAAIALNKAKIKFLLAKIDEIQDGDINPTASV